MIPQAAHEDYAKWINSNYFSTSKSIELSNNEFKKDKAKALSIIAYNHSQSKKQYHLLLDELIDYYDTDKDLVNYYQKRSVNEENNSKKAFNYLWATVFSVAAVLAIGTLCYAQKSTHKSFFVSGLIAMICIIVMWLIMTKQLHKK